MLQPPNLSKKKVSSVINAEDTQKLAILGSGTKEDKNKEFETPGGRGEKTQDFKLADIKTS